MWSTREMQRDQEYWGKDADEWRPDRWYTARPTIAYAPFNAGESIELLEARHTNLDFQVREHAQDSRWD